MGHATYRGLFICVVHTTRALARKTCVLVRAKRARVCAFAYFCTDYLKICWEHTTTHHKC
jgi:hypothetical protein